MAKSEKPKKPLSKHYRGNNRGGFGNPPVSAQFKKDNPGGPGRKKKEASIVSSLQRMFGSKVIMGADGEATEVSMTDAMALRIKKELLTGSPRLLEFGLKLAEQYGPEHIAEEDRDDWTQLSITEKNVLIYLLKKLRKDREIKDANGRAIHAGPKHHEGLYRFFVCDDGFMELERVPEEPPPPVFATNTSTDE